MTKNVSLIALLVLVVGTSIMFYKVIQPFLFSLLLAAILAVLFRPVFSWMIRFFCGRRRLAAAATTLGIFVLFMLPIVGGLVVAGTQLAKFTDEIIEWRDSPNESAIGQQIAKIWESSSATRIKNAYNNLPEDQKSQITNSISDSLKSISQATTAKTVGFIADAFGFIVGMVIMLVALYYFFADGHRFLAESRRLSPLDSHEENMLLSEFERLCRGVILGTLSAAVVQGLLSGIGFAIVGMKFFWLLAVLAMVFSFIPFMGAASVWICVCVVLLLDQQWWKAGFIALYGATIISMADNIVRAYVIGGEAKLHPLIVLVTVLGAIQLIGLWGIFVGPMVAAFFYAVLRILRNRLLESQRNELEAQNSLDPAMAVGGSGIPVFPAMDSDEELDHGNLDSNESKSNE